MCIYNLQKIIINNIDLNWFTQPANGRDYSDEVCVFKLQWHIFVNQGGFVVLLVWKIRMMARKIF